MTDIEVTATSYDQAVDRELLRIKKIASTPPMEVERTWNMLYNALERRRLIAQYLVENSFDKVWLEYLRQIENEIKAILIL